MVGTNSNRRIPSAVFKSERTLIRPPLSAEDIRVHARLAERVATIYYERHGLWPKIRRFLAGLR
jgi:hypothetical protein